MGRELKRVPLDFNWPLNQPWDGYCNPYYASCPHCKGGYSNSYEAIKEYINGLMWSRAVLADKNVATITTFLCGREPRPPFGHDSSDAYSAIFKLGTLAGLSEDWYKCQHCDGSSIDPSIKAKYEAWERTEPPTGDGYQIWETVSEGSPISPVFATPEELAAYMSTHKWGADTGGSRDTWLHFINGPGWSPSMVMDSHGIRTGADAAFAADEEEG